MIEQLSPTANGRSVQIPAHESQSAGPRDVAVIGGGLAGLTAAITAARAGRSVLLFDGASALGGRARTRDERGFHFNVGSHALYRGGAGMQILRDLGVEPRGGVPDASGALAIKDGRIQRLPAGVWAFLTTSLLDAPARLDLGLFLARLAFVDPTRYAVTTVRAWLDEALRTQAARQVVEVLIRTGTYADAPERLSAEAAIRQLKAGVHGVVYLDGGWQSLVDNLRARAVALGVRIETGARVVAVEHDAAVRAVHLSDQRRQPASAAVLTVDPEEASALLGRRQPQVAHWARTATPVRVASFDLGLRRLPRPEARLAFGFDRPLFQSVHSAWAKLAPDRSALIHVTRYLGEVERGGPDDEREIEALLDLTQPGWREEVVIRRFVPSLVVSNALPTIAWQTTDGPATSSVDGVDGLFVAGDWVGRDGMLADRALLSGSRAGVEAAAVADARAASR